MRFLLPAFLFLSLLSLPSRGHSEYIYSSCIEVLRYASRSVRPKSTIEPLAPLKIEKKYDGLSMVILARIMDSYAVLYLFSNASRERFRYVVRDGALVSATKNKALKDGDYIVVMDVAGNIYVLKPFLGFIHHSTIMAGGKVAAAGELTVAKGRITRVTGRSGHYYTPGSAVYSMVRELASNGADLSKTIVKNDWPRPWKYPAKEFLLLARFM